MSTSMAPGAVTEENEETALFRQINILTGAVEEFTGFDEANKRTELLQEDKEGFWMISKKCPHPDRCKVPASADGWHEDFAIIKGLIFLHESAIEREIKSILSNPFAGLMGRQ